MQKCCHASIVYKHFHVILLRRFLPYFDYLYVVVSSLHNVCVHAPRKLVRSIQLQSARLGVGREGFC